MRTPSPVPNPQPLGQPLDITAAIVNYGTPDLTRAAAWSLRTLYPDLPIVVLDNASPDDSKARLAALSKEAGGITIITAVDNLHHGPGLDHAIRRCTTPWVLSFDSDCVAYRAGFLEGMRALATSEPRAYMVGQLHRVDDAGFDVAGGGHLYVHPKCALVRREAYLLLPPFQRHGAPCLANERAAVAEGLALLDYPVRDYVLHIGEGTVSRFGYGLGAGSRVSRLKRAFRRR